MAGETGTKTPRCGQVLSGDEEDDCNDCDYLAADKYWVVVKKMIATIMITMIMTMMTDGNQMMMAIVMITETGT